MDSNQKKKCLICLNSIIKNLIVSTNEVHNIRRTCVLHLEVEIVDALLAGMRTTKTNELQMCQSCYRKAKKIYEADRLLEKLQSKVPKLTKVFSKEINQKRSSHQTQHEGKTKSETVSHCSTVKSFETDTTMDTAENVDQKGPWTISNLRTLKKDISEPATDLQHSYPFEMNPNAENDNSTNCERYENDVNASIEQYLPLDTTKVPVVRLTRLLPNPCSHNAKTVRVKFESVSSEIKPWQRECIQSRDSNNEENEDPSELGNHHEVLELFEQAAEEQRENVPLGDFQNGFPEAGNHPNHATMRISSRIMKKRCLDTKGKNPKENPKQFKCSVCKKIFSRKGNLNRHRNTHVGKSYFDTP